MAAAAATCEPSAATATPRHARPLGVAPACVNHRYPPFVLVTTAPCADTTTAELPFADAAEAHHCDVPAEACCAHEPEAASSGGT